jgi:hypothetical protein
MDGSWEEQWSRHTDLLPGTAAPPTAAENGAGPLPRVTPLRKPRRTRKNDASVGADAPAARTELLLKRLIQSVRLETNAPALIKNLIDFARSASALKIVNDHVSIVAQIPLATLGLSWF